MSFLNSTATSPLGYPLSAYMLWGQIKLKIKCILIHISECFNLLFHSLSHAILNLSCALIAHRETVFLTMRQQSNKSK